MNPFSKFPVATASFLVSIAGFLAANEATPPNPLEKEHTSSFFTHEQHKMSEDAPSPLPPSHKEIEFSLNAEARDTPFLYLMGIAPEGKNPRRFDIPEKDLQLLTKLEEIYQQATPLLFPKNIDEEQQKKRLKKKIGTRIPKIIHFIWGGAKEFPKESVQNVKTWQKKHPDWTFYFWTDSEDRSLPIPEMKRKLVSNYSFGPLQQFVAKTENWGEKSDLMRYIILMNEGGVYIDHDNKCYRSFKDLCQFFDFVVGLERPHHHKSIDTYVLPSNGLIAARPKHPILKATVDRICQVWDVIEEKYKNSTDPKAATHRILERTYDSFALSTLENFTYSDQRKDLILPSSYFYSQKLFKKQIIRELQAKKLIYAIHTYAGSWKENEASTSDTDHKQQIEEEASS